MLRVLSVMTLLVYSIVPLHSQSKSKNSEEIKKQSFAISDTLDADIYSAGIYKIAQPAGVLTRWKVIESVKHGSKVQKGDVLIRFDDEEFQNALVEKGRNLKIQKLNLDKQRRHYEINLKKMELDLKRIKINGELTSSSLEMYNEKGHGKAVLEAKQLLEDAKKSLEYHREELKQLEKMYSQDKISEETEEIVLKRQKYYVIRKEQELKMAEITLEQALKHGLPKKKLDFEQKAQKSLLDEKVILADWENFKAVEKLRLAASELAYDKAEKTFNDFKKAKERLVLKSPIEGIVYYGSMINGKWIDLAGSHYKKDEVLTSGKTLMSIVDPASVLAFTKIKLDKAALLSEDADYFLIGEGLKAWQLTLTEKDNALRSGFIHARFSVKDPIGLQHDMKAKISVRRTVAEDVIVISEKFIKAEVNNPLKKFVTVQKGSSEQKVFVETGFSWNGRVVIEDGLEEGDIIVK